MNVSLRARVWVSECDPLKKHVFTNSALYVVGVDRYVFFRADTDTDYYRSSRPITDILNRYMCLV